MWIETLWFEKGSQSGVKFSRIALANFVLFEGIPLELVQNWCILVEAIPCYFSPHKKLSTMLFFTQAIACLVRLDTRCHWSISNLNIYTDFYSCASKAKIGLTGTLCGRVWQIQRDQVFAGKARWYKINSLFETFCSGHRSNTKNTMMLQRQTSVTHLCLPRKKLIFFPNNFLTVFFIITGRRMLGVTLHTSSLDEKCSWLLLFLQDNSMQKQLVSTTYHMSFTYSSLRHALFMNLQIFH